MTNTVELVVDAKATLGEGPIWHAQRQVLYWVDILEKKVHIYDPAANQDRAIDVGQYVGTVVPRKSGGLMLALHHGFASLDPDTQQLQIIHDPESHLPDTRFNDGKCDPAGRFWAGTMSLTGAAGAGSLYCMDKDLRVRKILDKVTVSNGIAWSLDHKTMYFIDTPTQAVAAFDYDIETGSIANRRVVVSIPKEDGLPDGMTIDAEGMLWVAHWGGSRVTRWNPANGKLLQTISVPAAQTTACWFGGPDLDVLYITSARHGLNERALAEQPYAGGIFCVRPGVRGLEAYEFAG